MIDYEKLSKEIDKNNQENFEKYGIRSLGDRIRIIRWLLSFADKAYQIQEWFVGSSCQYAYMTEDAYNFLIEDTNLEKYLEREEMPYDRIGWLFKTTEEVEKLYKFCQIFNDWLDDVPARSPNECYINSKFYEPMVKAAQSTIEVFFKNEENKLEDYSKM
jgi:hypothetical protein